MGASIGNKNAVKDIKKESVITIRVDQDLKNHFINVASLNGQSLSAWIIDNLEKLSKF